MANTGSTTPNFRVVPAGKFKATCLQLIDEVFAEKGLSIIITKRGIPLAQLIAPPPEIKLSAPQVLLSSEAPATEAHEENRKKKRKGKKKKK